MPYTGLGDAHEASLYRALVRDLSEYAIFRIGTNAQIESWNSGVERLLGYSEREFIGLPFAQLFTPEDRDQKVPELELRTAAEQGRASDNRWHVRKNRTRFFCDGVLTTIPRAGHIVGFTKVMRDVTERKRAEVEITELASALDLTHTIIHQVDGTILVWTQGAEFLYGWAREEALGCHTHELLKTKFSEPLDVINERLLELGEWQGELTHRTKDGRCVTVASHWVLHARSDDAIHVIEVNNDISESRRLLRELRGQTTSCGGLMRS